MGDSGRERLGVARLGGRESRVASRAWLWPTIVVLGFGFAAGLSLGRFLPTLGAARTPNTRAPMIGGSVSFNQHFVEGLGLELDLEQPKEVFAHVFSALPAEARVKPTENYYYFSFTASGRYIWGNLRLGPEDRDKGVLHFAYFVHGDSEDWEYLALGEEDGVAVARRAKLDYDVAFQGKTVRFRLNPLSQEPPKAFRYLDGERFVGRCQDESGFVLLLIYSKSRKHFLFALDEENGVNWGFKKLDHGILLHPSSGFAFYDDPGGRRKVLAGVSARNIALNNYFDGPFDQLPDNYLAETPFGAFVEEAYPYARGHIDRYGKFLAKGIKGRMAITPYLEYDSLDELLKSLESATKGARQPGDLYRLLCHDPKTELPAETLAKPSEYGGAVLRGRIEGG